MKRTVGLAAKPSRTQLDMARDRACKMGVSNRSGTFVARLRAVQMDSQLYAASV
jgi:hypothetical protein